MITVFKTPTCAYCKAVTKLFDMRGVEYKTVDISEDYSLRQQVIDKSGASTVPVTVVGDWESFIVGWNPKELLALSK